jgi:uncharacterized membrane protein
MAAKIRAAAAATPREIVKTLSFALVHFTVAFSVAYALTGSIAIATGIGLVEQLANTIAFYFHERAWTYFESQPMRQPLEETIA